MGKRAPEKHTQLPNKYSRYVEIIFLNQKLKKTKEAENYILTATKFIPTRFLVY